jgi:hypothetical protein
METFGEGLIRSSSILNLATRHHYTEGIEYKERRLHYPGGMEKFEFVLK